MSTSFRTGVAWNLVAFAILALSGFRSEHLCGRLDAATIEDLGRIAAKLGFSAAR